MSVLKSKNEEQKLNFRKILLPLYIILSLIFIVYIAYSYIMGAIYRGGIMKGQEQGYARAIQDLMSQAGSKCDPVTLNFGKDKIEVVNVACLQKQEKPIQEDQSEK